MGGVHTEPVGASGLDAPHPGQTGACGLCMAGKLALTTSGSHKRAADKNDGPWHSTGRAGCSVLQECLS